MHRIQSFKRDFGVCLKRSAPSLINSVILSGRHSRKRVIQYSRALVIEPRSSGVLDTPLSRGTTAVFATLTPAVHIQPRFTAIELAPGAKYSVSMAEA
jgi:hypothetical protein